LKKILILAYDFPPKKSVGAERPYGWYKYLSKYGVEPTVITIDQVHITSEQKNEISRKNTVVWTKPHFTFRDKFIEKYKHRYPLLRKFLSLFVFLGEFISFRFDSKCSIYYKSRSILKSNKFDLIIATGEPFILFKYASLISKEFNIPWIADYRDDWVQNHALANRHFLYRLVFKLRNKYFEKLYLSNVSIILTVNKDIQDKIQNRLKEKPIKVLQNGFDIDLILSNEILFQENFIISYAGILYDFDYMKPFVMAFHKFMDSFNHPKDVFIMFYGLPNEQNRAYDDVANLQKDFPNNVKLMPYMVLSELIPELQKSSLFLNLIAADPSKGYLGTKIYMYACLEKPIISIPSVENDTNIFFPQRNIHSISYKVNEIFELLSQFYNQFKTNGYLKTDISDIEKFSISRENNAINLVDIINGTITDNKKS